MEQIKIDVRKEMKDLDKSLKSLKKGVDSTNNKKRER